MNFGEGKSLNDFDLSDLVIKSCIVRATKEQNESTFRIFIENILLRTAYKNSKIDDRVKISKFQWTVTLITFHGSEGNHAEIFVEGLNDGFTDRVKNGEYFLNLSHFTGFEVQTDFYNDENSKKYLNGIETRTQIWKKSSDKVKIMLKNIASEVGKRIKYEMLGNLSIFGNGGHSCFTWAREHLKILNITLKLNLRPPNFCLYMEFIVARTKDYTTTHENLLGDSPHKYSKKI